MLMERIVGYRVAASVMCFNYSVQTQSDSLPRGSVIDISSPNSVAMLTDHSFSSLLKSDVLKILNMKTIVKDWGRKEEKHLKKKTLKFV